MKKLFPALLFLTLLACEPVQKPTLDNTPSAITAQGIERPKLVVGIVVDQIRADYIYRFYPHFGDGGFKRLMLEGYNNKNTHYNYIPTYTGPGHASIYTGTTPAYHGIISNDWYSKEEKKMVYCAGDEEAIPVGTDGEEGKMSPHRLQASTITDELKLFTQQEAKVVGISIKDRGAIMPAGHTPNGAYWFERSSGNFVSSNWYTEALPQWVNDFNDRKLAQEYLSQTWETLLPIEQYKESGPDDVPWEGTVRTKESPTFPYDLKTISEAVGDYYLLPSTPYGNTIITQLAQAAVTGEQMGSDAVTDFLAVSYSSTDYVGHMFGPNSKELEDTYVRLDRELAELFGFLDTQVGKGQYLVFLTADHGVAYVPGHLQSHKIPAGSFDVDSLEQALDRHLIGEFGTGDWVENISANQVFLNRDLIKSRGKDVQRVKNTARTFIAGWDNVRLAVDAESPALQNALTGVPEALRNGWHPKRSGDILFDLEPAWFPSSHSTGTTHGSAYAYDTHVPLLWYGWHVPAGSSTHHQEITDIAPTLSMMLHIPLPNATTGQPISDLCD